MGIVWTKVREHARLSRIAQIGTFFALYHGKSRPQIPKEKGSPTQSVDSLPNPFWWDWFPHPTLAQLEQFDVYLDLPRHTGENLACERRFSTSQEVESCLDRFWPGVKAGQSEEAVRPPRCGANADGNGPLSPVSKLLKNRGLQSRKGRAQNWWDGFNHQLTNLQPGGMIIVFLLLLYKYMFYRFIVLLLIGSARRNMRSIRG